MPEAVLLDQNVPRAVAPWLAAMRPTWRVQHTADIGMGGAIDDEIAAWAEAHRALIVTFDEDFTDRRSARSRHAFGVIRLRVWPTTEEEVRRALWRLLETVADDELDGAMVIIDERKIRIRHPRA